jgi:hypothetical protein
MEANEFRDDDEDPVESYIMAWGLPGFVLGLVVINVGIFYLWRYALSLFYPGA